MLSYELYEKIVQYTNSIITLAQLEDWLVPRLPGFLESLDSPDADAVGAIELGLAEMSDGIRSDDEFCQLLKDVLERYPVTTVDYSALEARIVTGSSNTTSPEIQFPAISDFAVVPV